MGTFYGNVASVSTPNLNITTSQHTSQQINDWWDMLATGADAEDMDRDLNTDPRALYFLDDTGMLTPAVRAGEATTDESVRGRLFDQAQAGRLFFHALGEENMRQVRTTDTYDLAFSKPVTSLPPVQGEIPKAPKPPFFLKYLLYPFFKSEFQEYKEKKKAYDQAIQHKEVVNNFATKNKSVIEEAVARDQSDLVAQQRLVKRQELKAERQAKEREQERIEEEQRKKRMEEQLAEQKRLEAPSDEEVAEFEERLNRVVNVNFIVQGMDVFRKTGVDVDDYCISVAELLEKEPAQELLEKMNKLPENERKDFLKEYKRGYDAMVRDMQEFVYDRIDTDRVSNIFRTGGFRIGNNWRFKSMLQEERKLLATNGWKEFKALKAKQHPDLLKTQPESNLQTTQQKHQAAPSKGGR